MNKIEKISKKQKFDFLHFFLIGMRVAELPSRGHEGEYN